jgi:hypothetical protein
MNAPNINTNEISIRGMVYRQIIFTEKRSPLNFLAAQ